MIVLCCGSYFRSRGRGVSSENEGFFFVVAVMGWLLPTVVGWYGGGWFS